MKDHGKTSTLFVRGVGSKYIKSLQEESKNLGYPTVGAYLNELFGDMYGKKTRDKVWR